jgi:glycosyltransferase involved in cell wall biosynthesis
MRATASLSDRQEHPRQQPAARKCRSVLMVGTDLRGIGGIRGVVCGYRDAGLFERVGCTYVATHRYGPARVKLAAALRGWARVAVLLGTLDAPLVHVHLASRASFWRKLVVCRMARLARRPYLLHLHGGEFLKFYQEESAPLAQRLIRKTFADAAVVIALSEQWRERVLRICPTARIEVLSNGVALPELGRVQRLESREPTVLFLGELSRGKGVYDLVRAVARLAEEFPRLRLVCAGTGASAPLRQLALQLEIGDRVRCPGWLEGERKQAELAGATAFALPSYAEGMPMALLEAMSWGLPVIATSVGGIPQVVTDGVDGLLIAPGDIEALSAALARLLRDAALRERLGKAARATVAARFSVDTAVARLCEIYGRFGIRGPINAEVAS